MHIEYLRSSSYSRFDFCPLLYYLEYCLGWTSPSGKKATMGTIVHGVLETIATLSKAKKNKQDTINNKIVGKISTNIYNIDGITAKVYNYYKKHSTHLTFTQQDYKDCEKWVHKTLEFNNGQFDPRKQNIVQSELPFDIPLEYDWALLRNGKYLFLKGTIDLVVQESETRYHVQDYKTGARKNWSTEEVKEHQDLQDDIQVRLYHYVIAKLYPELTEILVTIYYINDGGPFTICLNLDDDLIKTEQMLKTRFEEIRDCIRPPQNKTWKCSKLCGCGKTSFEDTEITPTKHNGKYLTKCEQIWNELQKHPIDVVTKHYTKPGFSVDYYQPPGEVQIRKKYYG